MYNSLRSKRNKIAGPDNLVTKQVRQALRCAPATGQTITALQRILAQCVTHSKNSDDNNIKIHRYAVKNLPALDEPPRSHDLVGGRYKEALGGVGSTRDQRCQPCDGQHRSVVFVFRRRILIAALQPLAHAARLLGRRRNVGHDGGAATGWRSTLAALLRWGGVADRFRGFGRVLLRHR